MGNQTVVARSSCAQATDGWMRLLFKVMDMANYMFVVSNVTLFEVECAALNGIEIQTN